MAFRGAIGALFSLAFAIAAASCTSQSQSFNPPAPVNSKPLGYTTSTGSIKHVVIIFQENRTTDYLFQGIPGADIATYGVDSHGDRVPLVPVSLATSWDLGHNHTAFLGDYDNGKMDGFGHGLPQKFQLRPFAYGLESELYPYHEMAKRYVLADHMFQSNQGGSFPAHLYLVSGTATDPSIEPYLVSRNPHSTITGKGTPGGCDAIPSAYVETINPKNASPGPTPFPCFDRPVLSDFLDAKGVSWRYYQSHFGAGDWYAFDAIRHVRYGSDFANVVTPSQTILSDIRAGQLAGVSWVIPASQWSDHAGGHRLSQGPAWVAAIVNAIGESDYWKDTAIFITWDDWGGWYDHVPPPIKNAYELGFRVPLVIVSPYAKKGYVSKKQHEFGSILAFTEEAFGIPKGALKATDRRADDLMDAFDFAHKARSFTPIKAPPFSPHTDESVPDEDP
jgi:phospholipase C